MPKLRITWVRSAIGHREDQKRTLRALGLRHLRDRVEQEDTSALRGMVHKVRHLIRVEEIEE